MKRFLVAYMSYSGSTRDVAQTMGNELSMRGFQVDVLPISEITDLSTYDCIIAGGLLFRFGWHPVIIQFLKNHLEELRKKKVALFVTGLRFIKTSDCDQAAFPVFVDPSIVAIHSSSNKKNILDSYTTMNGYLAQALPTIEKIKPVGLGFFAGKLDMKTLNLPEKFDLVPVDGINRN